jgi:hypothetical protein
MMAGNVTASVVNGTLTIQGDAQDNDLQVTQVAQSYTGAWPGVKLRIAGSSTTVNGQSSVTLAGIKNVTVHLGAGDDQFRVPGSNHNPLQTLPGNVLIEGGEGKDFIYLYYVANRSQVTVSGGKGNDFIKIGGGSYYRLTVNTNSVASASGQDEADLVAIHAKGTVILNGGAGDDQFIITSTSVFDGPLKAYLGDGRNYLSVEAAAGHSNLVPTVNGAMLVNGGSFQDSLIVSAGHINRTLTANLGDGHDLLTIFSSTDLKVDMGAGDDEAQLSGTYTGSLNGGADISGDTFDHVSDDFGPVVVTNFEK